MIGFIKLQRDIQGTWIHKDPIFFKAYCDILMNVNWEKKSTLVGNTRMICSAGEALYSLDSWARIFGGDWDKNKVRRLFKRLEKANAIRTINERNTTRLILVNTDTIEANPNATRTQPERNPTPTKEERNKKKEIKEKDIVDSSESTKQIKSLEFKDDYLFICEQFTSITGKGIRNKKTDSLIARSDKYKMVKARLKEGATVEEMIKVIELKAKQWKGTEYEKYVRFSTLFNKTKFETYLDELEETAPASSENHPNAPNETKARFKYFRNLFLKYAPHLENRLVNTEYRDRIYQKKDAEGLIRDLERQNPQLLEL